jgi:uncharacterized repeat protein (TIGR01451 family)
MTTGTRAHFKVLTALTLAFAALLVPAQSALAEGSVDFNTGAATTNRLTMMQYSVTNAPYNDGYVVLRAYAKAGETIQMGSSAMGLGGTTADIRIYAPGTSFVSASEPSAKAPFPGDPVFASQTFSCVAGDPATGRIESRAEEIAGPLPNPGGYDACEYIAPADGIYPIVMFPFAINGSGPTGGTVGVPNASTGQFGSISIWDVTVRNGGVVQPGRLFSNILRLQPSPFGTASNYAGFVYTPAGHAYHLQVFSPNGAAQDLALNGTGVVDAKTGLPTFASFQWANKGTGYPATPAPEFTEALAPQMYAGDAESDGRYPIFFRSPDPVAISGPGGLAETRGYATEPWAPEGGLTNSLSFTGAAGSQGSTTPGAGGTVLIDAPPLAGLGYKLAIDFDENGSFGGGGDLENSGLLAVSGNAFAWNGRDAGGAVVPCGTYAYQVSSSLPTMHVVQSDTENEAGIEIERLTLPSDPLLGDLKAAAYNDVDPYKATAVTNAAPPTVSEGTSGPTFHRWTASTGHTDFVDTWTPARPTSGTGAITVSCPQPPAAGGQQSTGGTNPPTKKPSNHKPKHRPGKPKLFVQKTANTSFARPSSVIGYTITVWNKGDGAARAVKICDEPPSGLTILRSEPAAAGKGSTCWNLRNLAALGKRVFRVTAQVASSAGGMERNVATVSAANVKGVRSDSAGVRVKPLPNTACGSRAARIVIAPRC